MALLPDMPIREKARKARYFALAGILAATSIFAGCSAHPEDVPAQNVSDFQFTRFSCSDLAKVQFKLHEFLITASNEQNQARLDDIYGYIFLLTPLGRLSGRNLEPRIALYKGELQAAQRVAQAKRCEYSPA